MPTATAANTPSTVIYKSKCISIPRKGEVVKTDKFLEGTMVAETGEPDTMLEYFIVASDEQLRYVKSTEYAKYIYNATIANINQDAQEGILVMF